MSPELVHIKDIPSFVNYKVSYFSFGYLLLLLILGDDIIIKTNETSEYEKIRLYMETIRIKNTKLYWLIKRCLVEDPKNRSIVFI
jgi:hypothetical protein